MALFDAGAAAMCSQAVPGGSGIIILPNAVQLYSSDSPWMLYETPGM